MHRGEYGPVPELPLAACQCRAQLDQPLRLPSVAGGLHLHVFLDGAQRDLEVDDMPEVVRYVLRAHAGPEYVRRVKGVRDLADRLEVLAGRRPPLSRLEVHDARPVAVRAAVYPPAVKHDVVLRVAGAESDVLLSLPDGLLDEMARDLRATALVVDRASRVFEQPQAFLAEHLDACVLQDIKRSPVERVQVAVIHQSERGSSLGKTYHLPPLLWPSDGRIQGLRQRPLIPLNREEVFRCGEWPAAFAAREFARLSCGATRARTVTKDFNQNTYMGDFRRASCGGSQARSTAPD